MSNSYDSSCIKVLKGLRLVLVVIKIQYEKILAIKTQCFDAFPPNYRRKVMYYEEAEIAISNAKANSYPLLKLYRSILDCYKSIDEKALRIKHIHPCATLFSFSKLCPM